MFKFRIKHRPGRLNAAPDCASRYPAGTPSEDSRELTQPPLTQAQQEGMQMTLETGTVYPAKMIDSGVKAAFTSMYENDPKAEGYDMGENPHRGGHRRGMSGLNGPSAKWLLQVTQRPPTHSSCFLVHARRNILPCRGDNQRQQNPHTPTAPCGSTRVSPFRTSRRKRHAGKCKTTIVLARVGR